MMLPRRSVLLGGIGLIISSPIAKAQKADMPVVITMRSDAEGSHVGFDPVGLLIQPGQMLRFLCEANYHTTAAYHPENGSHSLRIPHEARPWASDVLQPGDHFDVRLSVPGVYDYFCAPHEEAGMVGRIIVGQPTGPGSLPFDWFKDRPEASGWLAVPPAAQAIFPSVADIMRKRQVPAKATGPRTGTAKLSEDHRVLDLG